MNNCYDCLLYKDYCEVKSSLSRLVDDLTHLKVQASFSTPTSTRLPKKKGQKKAQGNNKKQVPLQLKPAKVSASESDKKQEKDQVTKETPKSEGVNIHTMSLPADQKEIVPSINNKISSIEIEEDSLESIERETNELFESIRQLIESDRKAKLELKELKAAQKKQREDDENKIIIIEKKPEIIKLSTGHQSTLDAIFSEEDCHLKLSGSEIENLINALGGRTKAGSKKKINIFWGSSTKKTGRSKSPMAGTAMDS